MNEKQELTIQEAIDRGWVECPKCGAQCSVSPNGEVATGGCFEYWNLFVQTGEAAVNDNR